MTFTHSSSTAIVKPQNSSYLKKPYTSYHIRQPTTFKSWTPISTSFSVSCVMTDNQSKVVVVVVDHDEPAVHLRPDSLGRFGKFGGKYVPETLMYALSELESAFNAPSSDYDFQEELNSILKDYVGRESPLYFAERLTEHYKRPNGEGPEIYLKREDLNHTGAHKINNAVAQALLAKKLGKERIIAETGAGQHGVATATVCARFGLQCIIYMGAQDMERQALNVFRMKLLGAEANDKRKAGPVIHSHGMESCLGYRTTNTSLKTAARKLDNEAGTTPHCVVLDIEGTTTPISFVTDVLFPYARDNVRMHIDETYDSADTKDDIKLLRSQVDDDLQNGVVGAVPVPSDDASKEEVIDALVANIEGMIKADRKITSLKQIQGHIWRTGFQKNELKGVVYDDVPEALERWHASGVKVYIYSSGSRLAQRLIFGYTNYGDLRQYLCGFFDTKMGNKKETKSYIEISESLGVDNPSEVLFVTDVYQEAVAAKAAGLEVIISIRPGNGPLPENHGFDTIKSFSEIPF